jgi:hypothetical protein
MWLLDDVSVRFRTAILVHKKGVKEPVILLHVINYGIM